MNPPTTAPPGRRPHATPGLRRLALGLALALALGLVPVLGGLGWLLRTTAGASWLLGRVPGLEFRDLQGSLAGDFDAASLSLHLPGGERIEIEALRWRGLHWGLQGPLLRAQTLQARRVRITPSGGPRSGAPPSLALPVGLQIDALQVDELLIGGTAFTELRAALELGTQQHRLTLHSLRWQQVLAQGEAEFGADAPLPTRLKLQLRSAAGPAWQAQIDASGPLAALQASAALQAQGQSLTAQARLLPFAAVPLGAARIEASSIDLAALHADLPVTLLSGRIDLQPVDASLRLRAEIRNARAGRWDQHRLPVEALQLDALADPADPGSLRITALQAGLPGGASLSATGSVQDGGAWRLAGQVQALRPEALDARLSPALLAGPLRASGGAGTSLALGLDLRGSLAGSAPLSLRAELRKTGTVWQIDQAELGAGRALASAKGQVSMSGPTRLRLQLREFDPGLLWRADLPAMRLNAEAELTAQLPQASGVLTATLLPSQLAGLPLDGRLRLQRPDARPPAQLELHARLGANTLDATGAISPASFDGRVQAQAPALAELARLRAALRLSGRAELDTQLSLRRDGPGWRGRAEGRASVADLSWGRDSRLDAASAQWSLPELDAAAPLRLALTGEGLRDPRGTLRSFSAQVDGRWAAHQGRLALAGSLPLGRGEPLALDASAQFSGGWDGQQWLGRVASLLIGPLRAGTPALLQARDLGLSIGTQAAEIAPGRAELAGASLQWQVLRWQAAPRLLRAELSLDPLPVAPLLARWQPDFGWGGDLRIGGSASLTVGSEIDADVLLQRLGGDLAVTDESGTQPLGLTELRLAGSVHERVWRFSQGLAGTQLGSFVAAQSLRAQGRWPDAQTPLEGVLQAQVEQVANWGAWAPAGWRLGGRLAASAQLGGRLGAPQWRGQATGEGLSVRQPLLGVDVREGRFALSLDGTRARLSQLEARGGDGWLRGSGEATLGESPTARLQLSADKLRVLARADRRLVASGQADIQLTADSLQLDGKLRADEGLVDFSRADAPALSSDVVVQRGPVLSAATPARTANPRKTRIDLALDFGDAFRIVGHGLQTQLRGALKLAQRDGPPRLTGKLHTEGGQYAAYGQKLDVERGELLFSGPYDNPALDLIAVRPNTDVRVGLRVSGNALNPRVALFSEPDLPETDKLAWLLLGRGPDGLGRTDTALLQRAALALLSGEGEGLTGRAIRGLGLDELSVAQAADESRATIVRLGKQLSRRWYVGYERSLNATAGSWQLIYRIAQRFTLRAQSGDDNALDLIWQWRWN